MRTPFHHRLLQPQPDADLSSPAPKLLNGARSTAAEGITAALAFCDSATSCPGVQDKICLLQRSAPGGPFMCQRVKACMEGGGKAAIIYNRDGSPLCETLSGGTLVGTPQTGPVPGCDDSTAYIPTVGLTIAQGQAIKALLDAGEVTATVVSPAYEVGGVGRVGRAAGCRLQGLGNA
jgi:hypothetical protein